ncbi:MAG: hypothetical protein ABJC13_02630 [Acidobacteriota bacterium]
MSKVLVRSFGISLDGFQAAAPRSRSQTPRLFLFGVIALGIAGIACTVAADPKSPFLGEWTFHTKGKRNEAHLALLKTGACRMELGQELYHSCSWLTESNGEATINYGKYLSLSSASAKVGGDELTFNFGNNPEAYWVLTRVGSQKETDVLDFFEGETLVESGDLRHGIAQLIRSADHGNSRAQNSLAWTYATSKHPEALDGKKAVAYAEKAIAQDPIFAYVDTLAAALARDGQFERAAKTQVEALVLLNQSSLGPDLESIKTRFNDRLALYKAGQAYIEP